MSLAGDRFYTSSAFWGVAVGVMVGVFGISATIWVTLRAANPKRRLYYMVLSDTPLITGRREFSEQLKVSYDDVKLKSPRLVTVLLISRGRRDIPREAFDEGKPLRLDLGTAVVDCVKVATSPSDRPDPAWTLKGSALLVGPSQFGQRQETQFFLLVDGEPPYIAPPQQTLLDVSIAHGDGETLYLDKVVRLALTSSAVVLLADIVAYFLHVSVVGVPAIIVALLLMLVSLVIAPVAESRKSRRF